MTTHSAKDLRSFKGDGFVNTRDVSLDTHSSPTVAYLNYRIDSLKHGCVDVRVGFVPEGTTCQPQFASIKRCGSVGLAWHPGDDAAGHPPEWVCQAYARGLLVFARLERRDPAVRDQVVEFMTRRHDIIPEPAPDTELAFIGS
jgi:hypothetical protein